MSEGRTGRAAADTAAFRRLPRSIWALGFVSLFMDTSSELVHSLLPVLMTSVLGASMVLVGFIEGVAEATATVFKVFSGAISDRLGKRKLLVGFGYALAAATKPIFALAPTIGWVFGARFVDRIGKGVRGAPRDALVAEITPPELRGAAYGLRQSLDSAGAFLGPVLALLLMGWLAGDIRAVMWVAVVPAFISVGVLVFGVREPAHVAGGTRRRRPRLADAVRLPAPFWLVLGFGAVMTLARFSEAFLVLRAEGVGLTLAFVPLVLLVMNVAYMATAYPAGAAADRLGARGLLLVGLLALVVADLLLAVAATPLTALAGAAVWGVHMGLTQGLLAKLVADAAPPDLLGTAFGVFGLVTGVTLLVASVVAGSLWSAYGPPATFLTGAGFALVAAAGLWSAPTPPTTRRA